MHEANPHNLDGVLAGPYGSMSGKKRKEGITQPCTSQLGQSQGAPTLHRLPCPTAYLALCTVLDPARVLPTAVDDADADAWLTSKEQWATKERHVLKLPLREVHAGTDADGGGHCAPTATPSCGS